MSVTRTTDTWTIACAGTLDDSGADELDRVVRVCLAEWPIGVKLDLTGLVDISDDGMVTLGDAVTMCKQRGIPVRMCLSLETPVQMIVDLDDEIRDRADLEDPREPASVRLERGGIVVSV